MRPITKLNPADPATALGRQVAELRKTKGLTQAGLAKKSGIKITAVRRCEQSGQIPLRRFARIVAALGGDLKIQPPANLLPETWEGILRLEKRQAKVTRRPKLGGLWDSPETP